MSVYQTFQKSAKKNLREALLSKFPEGFTFFIRFPEGLTVRILPENDLLPQFLR